MIYVLWGIIIVLICFIIAMRFPQIIKITNLLNKIQIRLEKIGDREKAQIESEKIETLTRQGNQMNDEINKVSSELSSLIEKEKNLQEQVKSRFLTLENLIKANNLENEKKAAVIDNKREPIKPSFEYDENDARSDYEKAQEIISKALAKVAQQEIQEKEISVVSFPGKILQEQAPGSPALNTNKEKNKIHNWSKVNDDDYRRIMNDLTKNSIKIVKFHEINGGSEEILRYYFINEIVPSLSTKIVGKKQTYPSLQEGEIYAIAILQKEKKDSKTKETIGVISCSSADFPRLVKVPLTQNTYVLFEEMVLYFISYIFSNYTIRANGLIRITRNTDISVVDVYSESLNQYNTEIGKSKRKLAYNKGREKITFNSKMRDAGYKSIMNEVAKNSIQVVKFYQISKENEDILRVYFANEIMPLLSTTIVKKKQVFPLLKEGEIYALSILKKNDEKKKETVGIISCSSDAFPRLIKVPQTESMYVLAEDLILHFMSLVFRKYSIKERTLLCISKKSNIDFVNAYDENLIYRNRLAEIMKHKSEVMPVKEDLVMNDEEDQMQESPEDLDEKLEAAYKSYMEAESEVEYYSAQLKAANQALQTLNSVESAYEEYQRVIEKYSSGNMDRAHYVLGKYGKSVEALQTAYTDAQNAYNVYDIDALNASLIAAKEAVEHAASYYNSLLD